MQVGDILIGLQGREFADYKDAVTQITKCCQSVPPQRVLFKVKHAPGCLGSTAPRVVAGGDARVDPKGGGFDPNVSANHSVAECKDNGGALMCRPPSLPTSMGAGVSAVSRVSASAAVTAANAGSVGVGGRGASLRVSEKKAGEGVRGGGSKVYRVDSEGDLDMKSDWRCPSCSQFNEGWRSWCNACLTARIGAASIPLPSPENKRQSFGMVADPSALDVSTDSDYDEEMFQGIDFSPPSCPPPPDTPVANMEDELQNQLRRLSVYNAGGD